MGGAPGFNSTWAWLAPYHQAHLLEAFVPEEEHTAVSGGLPGFRLGEKKSGSGALKF
jgi:hypothetical protein